jgi:hypothetical protein
MSAWSLQRTRMLAKRYPLEDTLEQRSSWSFQWSPGPAGDWCRGRQVRLHDNHQSHQLHDSRVEPLNNEIVRAAECLTLVCPSAPP